MKTEIWKIIDEYPNYMVSNLGRVKSLNYKRTGKEIIMSQIKDKKGYMTVKLCKNGKHKKFSVHRLVGLHFIPIPEHLKDIPIEKLDVGHLKTMPNGKEDTTANEVWNLAWMSKSENRNYGTAIERAAEKIRGRKDIVEKRVKKLLKPILQIDKYTNEIIKEWPSAIEVERQLGYLSICNCLKGRQNTCCGYKWKYKN